MTVSISRGRLWRRPRAVRPLVAPPSLRIAECVAQQRARWHVVHPSSPLQWPPPHAIGRDSIAFDLPAASWELGVLELAGGQVYGPHGWVIAPNGAVVPELSWYGAPSARIRVPSPLPEPVRLEGTCLSLVSDWSYRNYAHFLLDGIGRLALFRAAGFSLADVDHVYCPTSPSEVSARLLDRFGVPVEKRVWAAQGALVCPDTLVATSRPATALTYPDWLPPFLQQVVSRAGSATRRLYVSRRGYGRGPVQERELERLLVDHGFEVYDAARHRDQPGDFDQAAFVVGPHGAGLANLAFCRPGTRVVELLPTDNAHPFYYSLAIGAGLEYSYLASRSIAERPPGTFGPSPHDFELDLEALAAALP